jgi:ketosteroid isomerase-like protein
MSRADVETIRFAYEAVNRGDWEAASRAIHPDFEWKVPDTAPTSETVRGLDGFRRFYEDRTMAFDEVVTEPEQIFERGDQIVVFALTRFRPEGSSATPEIRIGHLWTMRDGKAACCEVFPEREKALEAAGRRDG